MSDPESFDLRALVSAAADGDEVAWREIVVRYTPLLVSVVRGFRLTPKEFEDVTQTVWLRMVEHLSGLREPYALPKWLMTTARHECLHCLQRERKVIVLDPFGATISEQASSDPDADVDLLEAERHQVLMAALAELPRHQRDLMLLLLEDPPLTYEQIADKLGCTVGYIGPTRARALNRIRQSAALQSFLGDDARTVTIGGDRDGAAMG